ncbi:MAG: ABC transporter substrate-binding protein [Rubellimicrobium sp.]|nr:ABC transporter substrate-binding protein [Rubellimicrobium sp.]
MKRTKLFTTTAMLTFGLAAAAQASTLVYCLEGSPEGFDPAPYTAGTTFDASSRAIYNRLIDFAPGSTDTVASLAESWEVAEDGLSITFHLRPGVKFQTTSYFTPTRDLNADDVIFSFERQLDQSSPWYAYAPGIAWEYFDSTGMASGIASIERVDDLTVRFNLTRPDVTLLSTFPMDFASIMSKEYADQLEAAGTMEQLNTHPVGTGPFTFLDYQQDAVIRYESFDDYWGGDQPIDNLVMAITVDPGVRQQKLLAGECDIIPYPNPSDIASLQANPDLNVMQQEGFNVGYLAYNTQMPPFDNPEVRRALNMAINQDAIIEAVFQGTGRAANAPLPPTSWAYNADLPAHVYDPEAARAALAAAGVSDLHMNIWAMPVQRPYNPNARRMAEMIQADFAAVGVTADIVSMEWGEYLAQSKAIDRDGAVLLGWTGDNADPDNFLGVLLSCDGVESNNRAQWCYEPFDTLIQQARVTADPAQRLELYRQAQEIFADQAPWFTVANSIVSLPMRNTVTGYIQDPLGMHRFLGVSVAE